MMLTGLQKARGNRVGLLLLGIGLAVLAGSGSPSGAATPAGTPIDNVAEVTYTDGTGPQTGTSPVARILVAPVPAAQLTPDHTRVVFPGQQVFLAHTLQAMGNVPLRFRFALQGSQWQPSLVLDANGNGIVDPGEGPPTEPFPLEPEASASLVIVVTVPESTPEGATDTFTLSATDEAYTLTVSATDTLRVSSDAPATIQLVAEPATILGNGRDRSQITATVLTARGTPVPDGTPVVFTTPRGTFENGLQTISKETVNGVAFAFLTAEVVSTVPVKALAHVVAGTPLTGTAEADVEIIFSPAVITGVITDFGTGQPVPNIPVTLTDESGQTVGTVTTLGDGTYDLFVGDLGTYILLVPVHNSVGDEVIIQQEVAVDRLEGLTFSPEGAIVGVVMDANTREPLPDVTLRLTGPTPQTSVLTTDARGAYTISGLALGQYQVEVIAADNRHYAYGRIEVSLNQAGEYVINADLLVDPLGYVYDRETDERIPGAVVTLYDAATGQPAVVPTGPNPYITVTDGFYQFLIAPGTYWLRATAEGYHPYEGTPFTIVRDVVNVNIPLDPFPRFALRKEVDRDQAKPGDELLYTLTLANGGGQATEVTVTDPLPEYLTPVEDSLGPEVSYDPATRQITWSVGSLARADGDRTLTFRVRIASAMPAGTTDLINSVQVTSSEVPEPVVAEPVITRVEAVPRLEITKVADRGTVVTGTTVNFTITIRNTGDAPATSVVVTDTLPEGLVAPDGSHTVTWRWDRLDPGAPQKQTLAARVETANLTPGWNMLTNRVAVTSAETPTPVEATADVQILVPYLRITKRAIRSEVQTGDVVPFEIVVENLSSTDEAIDLEIRDLLPPSLGYLRGTSRLDGAPAPDPEATGRTRTWRVSRLAPKGSVRLTFHCVVTAEANTGDRGEIVNIAEAQGKTTTGQPLVAEPSRAILRRRESVFSDRGLIIGRVFVDRNGNRRPDENEPSLASVAVFTETGVMAITDEDGKYVLPDVPPGQHVIRLDLITLPEGYTLVPIDTRSAGNPKSQFCYLPRGGLAKANFAAEGEGPTVGSARPGTPLVKMEEPQRK